MRCFSTLGCPQADLAAIGAILQRWHLDAVELRFLEGSHDLIATLARRFGDSSGFAEGCRMAGVRVQALDLSQNLAVLTAAGRATILDAAAWAEGAGISWLRVFDGGRWTGSCSSADLTAMAASFAWWDSERSRHGWDVDLLVETHDGLGSAESITGFIDRCPRPPAMLWDIVHPWRLSGEDPLVTWRRIAPWVHHVHLKDAIRTTGPKDHVNRLPGQGELDLTGIIAATREMAAPPVLSLEWELAWNPELEPLAGALDALEPFWSGAAG